MAFYPANVPPTSLAAGVSSSTTDLPVVDGASYPDPTAPGKAPYKVLVGYDTSREEVCLVTSKPSADTLRVTRGHDSSSATAKNAGDVVVPGVNAADFSYFQQVAADAAAHADTVSAAAVATVTGKVAKAGDTMTGPLVLPGNPTLPLQAAPMQYVDGKVLPFVVLQATGPGANILVTGTPMNLSEMSIEISQGSSLGSVASGTFSLTAAGYYQASLILGVGGSGASYWTGATSGIVQVRSTGGLPKSITLRATSTSTPYGMWVSGEAPGLTSAAAGVLVPALRKVNVLTPFVASDDLSPMLQLALVRLA
jgi:hypothetical protein